MAAGGGIDPIHQFHITNLVELKPLGINLSFTNTSLWMVIVLGVVSALMIYGSSQRAVAAILSQASSSGVSKGVW